MRGVESTKSWLRLKIFEEVARLAYEGWDPDKFHNLPYKIIPGDKANYRENVFIEREIVAERLRAAMGLSLRDYSEYQSSLIGVNASLTGEKYYEPPLIDIIKFACNKCPEKRVMVTDGCQGCLEHPCTQVCPKGAVSIKKGRSVIDQDKCIKCGMCMNACGYNAIIKQERPCVKVCGMNAISSDEYGRAKIDPEKCVSCGQCLVSCPFAAIIDKSQIFQIITAIQNGEKIYAEVAPAITGQFGNVTIGQLRSSLLALGFADVFEVSNGADLCTVEEAKDFLKEVPEEKPFMATSCCPAWSVMAKKLFPAQAECISMALTPMVLEARLIKSSHEPGKVCFIGPCAAKKLEASRKSVRSHVDYVLTFEELAGMFDAKEITVSEMPDEPIQYQSSKDGVGFAVSGGVAKAVQNVIREMNGTEIQIAAAEGLDNCKKLLTMAKAGKYNGYLLEGMACPGGCVAGAGTIAPISKAAVANGKEASARTEKCALNSPLIERLEKLEDFN